MRHHFLRSCKLYHLFDHLQLFKESAHKNLHFRPLSDYRVIGVGKSVDLEKARDRLLGKL